MWNNVFNSRRESIIGLSYLDLLMGMLIGYGTLGIKSLR